MPDVMPEGTQPRSIEDNYPSQSKVPKRPTQEVGWHITSNPKPTPADTTQLENILDWQKGVLIEATFAAVAQGKTPEVVITQELLDKHKAKAVARLTALILEKQREALDSYTKDLKECVRDYVKQYPDADINDFLGLIVGVRNQPQRIESLKAQQEKK